MTTVVAVERNGDVEFAADSQVSAGWRKSPNSFTKVFSNNGVVFGFAGSVRIANLLKWFDCPEPPKSKKVDDLERWLVRNLVPALSRALDDALALRVDSNEADTSSLILVAVNGRCFELSGDFSVVREGSGRYAIGSGQAYALGALTAGATPIEAVKIAASFDAFTGGKVQSASFKGLAG